MINMIAGMLGGDDSNAIVQSLKNRATSSFALVEKRLGEASYFAGPEFTAADIIMFFPLTTMRAFGYGDSPSPPNLRAYLKRIGERPAYQRAMAKGDPGMPLKLD
jgi:glutathione S-transferase